MDKKMDLRETLELMLKNEYRILSITSIENSIYLHGLKDKKYSKIEQSPRDGSFEKFIDWICEKCSFKYPSIFPQDGKIIEKVNSSEYSFLVTLLSLNRDGARVDFVRL